MSRLFVGASFYIQLPFLLLLYSMAFAGKLSPVMEQVLSQAPPDSEITVLARPALEVEIYALKRELESIRASRAERHRRVMTGLKRRSAAAQAGLLSELEAERTAGRVREYKPFWITNLVAVTASVQAVRKLASSKEVGEILENKAIQFLCEKKRKDSANSSSGRMSPETASTFKKFNWSLRQINAHKLWEKGLTGKGVLVANIDTGVDCNHPALKDKWRGANGALASECWFDAVGDRSIPMEMNILGMDSTRHGTGTMSQIVGQDGADTIGVAPDAQWIAAGFLSGGNDKKAAVLESFEWMADPDGDPETIDDVPDILNNSWAVYPLEACPTIYDEAINNLKALGVTPVFAAGNEGEEGSMSLVGPASNPKFFAVGATDKNNVVAKWSSKGPSPCDRQIIKPDVVAPGVDLLTAQPLHSGGGYIVASGTSGAAPLVAGIAALLKQYNPELTPDEITEAIRNSATDLGPSGPDNEYGWGLVNAEAALSLVEPAESPHFTITKIEVIPDFEDLVYPGEKARVILRLVNLGAEAGAVTAELSSKSPDVMVESAAASFGNLTTGSESSNSWAPFVLSFSPQMPENVTRTFNLQVFAGSLARMLSFSLKIGQEQEPPKKGYTTNAIGKAALSLTNYGVIGTGSAEGGGFKYPYAGAASPDHLYLGALLLATGPTTLSDADFNETTRGIFVGFDRDFSPVHGGNLKVQSPGSFADLEVTGIFSDNEAADPLGVRIYQRSYAWSAEADDDYVIVQYALRIPYGSESLAGVYVAQHLDWDVGGGEDSGEDDLVGFDSGLRLAYMYDNVSNVYVGHA
ncbi:MAG TPA: S8 family serine peptidase, partial [archaeon]|nr:S8 family serine peptidase [archaeon]